MTLFFVIPVRRSQGGLTLVELLVVLSLVAVLSTVALRSVSDTVVEKRYDANLQQLEEIKLAVLGDKDRAGFLGDIGRLPVARGSVDVEQLVELWDKNAAPFEDYAIRTPAGDGEVRLGTGWRGPYLNLGINRRSLTDGFGEPYRLWKADGTTAGDGEIVAIVQSLGADKGPGG
ncbi:MAG TPA: prepilin-type N-terminal cleavage/methylation domain-containing protein, partial [Bacteroidia bacterium]|nr:prepilin-type N-terminal cleavage/methylation domain-containing protein [Bacteroidia bacterium]